MIKATVNQSIYEVKEGTTLSDLAKQVQLPQEPIILLAYMDGKLRELFTPLRNKKRTFRNRLPHTTRKTTRKNILLDNSK